MGEEKKDKEKTKKTTIYIPVSLIKEVKLQMIHNNDTSFSEVIRELLKEHYLNGDA
ncbi:MAG: hypothetical protein ACOCQR_01425 [bacterium]